MNPIIRQNYELMSEWNTVWSSALSDECKYQLLYHDYYEEMYLMFGNTWPFPEDQEVETIFDEVSQWVEVTLPQYELLIKDLEGEEWWVK